MKTVFDSSAFAKRYVAESGSDMVDEICQDTSQLALCILCVPEIISALNRRLREGSLPHSGYEQAKVQLAGDVRDATLLDLTPTVIALAVQLLENNVLRAMDALHVACAVAWETELFVSADRRQLLAAERSGLAIRLV